MFTERLEGLQDRRNGEVRTGFLRGPAIHDRAVRKAYKRKAFRGLARRRIRPRGCGGDHGFQKRQANGGPDSLQGCSASNAFPGYEHRILSLNLPLLKSTAIYRTLFFRTLHRLRLGYAAHPELIALDHRLNDGRKSVVFCLRIAQYPAD